jgi:hypothetical protein
VIVVTLEKFEKICLLLERNQLLLDHYEYFP